MNDLPHHILFRTAAKEDLQEAFDWYERQRPGLGHEFMRQIASALNRADVNPKAFAILRGNIRRILVDRFPYGVYFFVDQHSLTVIAVMHAKRHPRRWQS